MAHAIVIAVARVRNDPNYQAYRKGYKKILPKFRELLQVLGVDLRKGGGIPELQAFQRHLSQYRIVMYLGLRCDNIMFDGQTATPQRINLLYADRHYHVITNVTAAMAKEYVWPAYNKGCRRGLQHKCEASCDACSTISPASRTMPGSPVTSVIDTTGKPRASKIINVSKYQAKPCVKPRNFASVVLSRESIMIVIRYFVHSV